MSKNFAGHCPDLELYAKYDVNMLMGSESKDNTILLGTFAMIACFVEVDNFSFICIGMFHET